jgi:hypothetical protein
MEDTEMSKKARVVIKVEENFADEVQNDTFDKYDEVDTIGDFAENVWRKRLEKMDLDDRILDIDGDRVDD